MIRVSIIAEACELKPNDRVALRYINHQTKKTLKPRRSIKL